MGKYQIVINRLKALSKKDTATYASEMMAHPFSEDEGWGFSDVLRVGDSIKAVLQKRISTYYNVWNDENQQVERQCFQIVTEVPFEMDFHDGLLLAEGSNTQLNRVKQAFRQIFWNGFVYDEINVMPIDYISMLNEAGRFSSIEEISINDFQFEGCLIGRYNAKPTNQLNIIEKLGEHAKNIIRVKVNVLFAGEEGVLSASNKNVLILDSSEDAKEEFVDFLKSGLK